MDDIREYVWSKIGKLLTISKEDFSNNSFEGVTKVNGHVKIVAFSSPIYTTFVTFCDDGGMAIVTDCGKGTYMAIIIDPD